MKHIVKQSEPEKFRRWKEKADQPSYRKLRSKIKKIVKDSLLKEQGYICCYCEQQLDFEDSHIEHFSPQNDATIDSLDYNNLLCSCQNQLVKGTPARCGHLKDEWFDSDLLVSPLAVDCEKRFFFEGDGVIQPADMQDLAAITTIEKLGLNQQDLISLRNEVINEVITIIADETFTGEQLDFFVRTYTEKDSEGKFRAFWTTIQELFR